MNEFDYNDEVFILSSAYKGDNKIVVLPRIFSGYSNQHKKQATITGKSNVLVNTWAIFKTREEAMQGAVVYLIETKEYSRIINENSDINKIYKELELNSPELILKYMDCIDSE